MNLIKQTGSAVKQTAKQTAKQVARQIAQEPLEILKAAGRQVGAVPESRGESQNVSQAPQYQEKNPNGPTPVETQKRVAQSQRLMQAYENELKEIEQKKEQEDIQVKQAEMIQAQQKAQYQEQKRDNILQVVSKKGRKMFGKIGLKREQNKTETRMPPSS